MPHLETCLWFNGNAEEAVDYYATLFRDLKISETLRYGEAGPMPKGTVLTIAFQMLGQRFMALNAGPQFKFTEAISIAVHVETQEEIDFYWNGLTLGGEEAPCGWCKDKFGLSWQVVPRAMLDYMASSDADKARRATQAMMKMKKLDIATIRAAAEG